MSMFWLRSRNVAKGGHPRGNDSMIQCRRSLGGGVESSAASLVVRWDDGHLTELICFLHVLLNASCGVITSHPIDCFLNVTRK